MPVSEECINLSRDGNYAQIIFVRYNPSTLKVYLLSELTLKKEKIFNPFPPGQNSHQLTDDICLCIVVNEKLKFH